MSHQALIRGAGAALLALALGACAQKPPIVPVTRIVTVTKRVYIVPKKALLAPCPTSAPRPAIANIGDLVQGFDRNAQGLDCRQKKINKALHFHAPAPTTSH